jgi:hypothetical protein
MDIAKDESLRRALGDYITGLARKLIKPFPMFPSSLRGETQERFGRQRLEPSGTTPDKTHCKLSRLTLIELQNPNNGGTGISVSRRGMPFGSANGLGLTCSSCLGEVSNLMFFVYCLAGCYNLVERIAFARRRMAQKKAAKKAGKNALKKGAEYLRKGPKK